MKDKKYYVDEIHENSAISKLIPEKSRDLFKAIEDGDMDKVEQLIEEMARK